METATVPKEATPQQPDGGPAADPAATESGPRLRGAAPPSPAGPITEADLAALRAAPRTRLPRVLQTLWFGAHQKSFVSYHQRRFGDVFGMRGYVRGWPVVTCHPEHIRSLFKAPPKLVPTVAAESPLRPVLGPNSVLTANGPRHLRQRKLLLPPFHGEAIDRYREMIERAAEREIDRWPIGRPLSLAPRMQAITLDVIMAGIFGIENPRRGSLEYLLKRAIQNLLFASTLPGSKLAEWMNIGHDDPWGSQWLALQIPDRMVYAVIAKRRKAPDLDERTDILSLIMRAETEDGERLSDGELRDELMTLVLAGHETTANQLAWTWERLTRTPEAQTRLVETVRAGGDDAAPFVEATVTESMRSRPVIPMTARRVTQPWQLGPYAVPADTPVAISMVLLHHRSDLYPDPQAFRPERWLGQKPGTYEWIPFGGGTRRCLGAALAMAEMNSVLEQMARRLDIEAASPEPERMRNRNVTMIPARGGRVVIRSRR